MCVSPESFLEIYGAKDYSLGIEAKEEGLIDLALKQKKMVHVNFLKKLEMFLDVQLMNSSPDVCKSHPFQMKDGKLIQMSDIMCPVDWNISEFEKMMVTNLKKDETE